MQWTLTLIDMVSKQLTIRAPKRPDQRTTISIVFSENYGPMLTAS